VPALQVWGPEFKPQYNQKIKILNTKKDWRSGLSGRVLLSKHAEFKPQYCQKKKKRKEESGFLFFVF
jgi:hypothetical protein